MLQTFKSFVFLQVYCRDFLLRRDSDVVAKTVDDVGDGTELREDLKMTKYVHRLLQCVHVVVG